MTQGSESTGSDRPPLHATGDPDATDATDATVLHRFERWARHTPDAPAVIAGPDTLTYGQLDTRANRLAHHLLGTGLPAGALVAVGTARQAETVVSVLAALKAGAAYTVIDVEFPRAGQGQLAAAKPSVLLTHAAHQAALDDGSGLPVIRLGADAAAIAGRPAGPPERSRPGPGAVLFTGGPRPRAVAVGHARLLAAYEGWAEVARLTPGDRHLITCGPSVTGFAAGWTRALCSGGALVLAERSPWHPAEVRRAVEAERVSVVHTDPEGAARLLLSPQRPAPVRPSVPAARRADPSGPRALRLVTVTGDRLHLDEQAALAARLRTGVRLLNVYGPTESAGTGTWFELPQLSGPVDEPRRHCLIGVPFPGCRADLRDGEIRLTPPDGGDAIPTGDLGLLREDGLLEFRGRIRDRLTLDGAAVDPYAVESLIRGHEGVGAVIVAGVPGFRGVPRLVAYVAPPAGAVAEPYGTAGADLPDIDELREHLADRLPSAQRPRAVVRLRALPRNRAGQEDREALPKPAQGVPGIPARSAGKYGGAVGDADLSLTCVVVCAAVALGLVARVLTDVLWPGSTDLTGVPQPWAFLFGVLYLIECLAFGVGVVFLFEGRGRMLARGGGRALTTAAHLALVYLLVAWWPQDNLYRLAAKQDWPRQAALVYVFNVPLMIAAVVVACHAARRRTDAFDSEG
ncbi:AMP-binding protein [Streptomyces sp. NPDC002044]|uniref:AMP-binding protein n=1 Tax=Streptomyces sp. NPDC002044 TaxID=3154662 RepID=UPI0033270ED1